MEASRFSLPTPRFSVRGRVSAELPLALLVSVVAGYVVASAGDWKVVVAFGGGAVLVGLGVLFPAVFLVAFLVLRPLADWLSGTELIGGVNAAGTLAVLMIVVAVVALGARERQQLEVKVGAAFVAVLCVSGLAAVLALNRYGSELGNKPLAEVVRLGSLFAVFLLASRLITDPRKMRLLFVAVGLSAVIPALVGLYQWAAGIEPVSADLGFGRLVGTFVGPNAFGVYLAVAAVILLSPPGRMLPRWARWTALIPILAALFGTYSRAGWGLLLISLILLQVRERRALVLAAAIVAAVVAINTPGFSERVLRAQPVESSSDSSTLPSSFQWRLDNWRLLLQKYAESPVTGYGLQTAEVVNPRRRQTDSEDTVLTGNQPSSGEGASPHNSAVRALVEGGPLLLGAWIVLFVALIRGIRRLGRKHPDLAPYARVMAVLWIADAVTGIVSEDALQDTAVLFALLGLTGALAGVAAVRDRAPRRDVAKPRIPPASEPAPMRS